jgi:hypothetical protein
MQVESGHSQKGSLIGYSEHFTLHSITLTSPQRSQVSPDEIFLPEEIEDVEMDQVIASGSADNAQDFHQKVAIAEKALLESDNNRNLARRTKKDVLQALCQDRRLDDKGEKIELASRLIDWVGPVSSVMQE